MFDASELNTLALDLAKVPAAAAVKVSAAIRKTAFDIEATAKQIVPVDTGNLRASISTSPVGQDRELRPGDMDAEIGPTASYGRYVEEGTARHGPAAYMGPSFDMHAHELEDAAELIVGDIL